MSIQWWWTTARTVVLGAAIAYALVVALLWLEQDDLIYRPPPPSSRPWSALTVVRPDVTLHGWVVRPHARNALVLFGGNATALALVAEAWSGCTEDALVLVPYRGYEGQAGTPDEARLVSDGIALVRQIQRAYDRVTLVGVSLGSGVATQVAAATRPARLLLVTPYDRLDRVAQDHYPWVPVRWLMHDHYDSVSAVRRLAGVPVALLQADQDEVVYAARTRTLASAIPGGPAAWVHVPSTHNGIWNRPELCRFIHTQTYTPAEQAQLRNMP